MDDIPEVLRETPNPKSMSPQTLPLLWFGGLGISAILVLGGLLLYRSIFPPTETTSSPPTPVKETPAVASSPSPEPIENILGHLPYEEAPTSELKAIASDNRLRLRRSAAESYLQMQRDARASGVILTPLSGFRTLAEQEYLFFEIKRQRNQETRKRAEVSAPPKYSEHHTGYAIDIGDGKAPATNLSQSFEKTAAFSWLKNNAPKYSFELSFPPNNPQGVSYEPWHWRYVGDRHSLETFYKAKSLTQPTPSQSVP